MPFPPSNIWTFQIDPPIAQNAAYNLDKNDRAYIDSQILGLQTHVVKSLVGGIIASWFTLDGSSASVAIGDVVCLNGTTGQTVIRATSTPLAAAGSALGIAISAAAPGGSVQVAIRGILPPSITGMTTGSPTNTVALVAAARATAVPYLQYNSFGLGTVDAAANLTLNPLPIGVGYQGLVTPPARITSAGSVGLGISLVLADTSGGAFAITMPTSTTALDGTQVTVKDAKGTFNTNNLTVNSGAGNTIENPASLGTYGSSQVLNTKGACFRFYYDLTQHIWLVD